MRFAARGHRRLRGIGVSTLLVGRVPAGRRDPLGLPAGVDLGVELEHRRPELGGDDGLRAGRGRADGDLPVPDGHHVPVGLGPADEEVPVGRVVLDDLLQRGRGRCTSRSRPYAPMRSSRMSLSVVSVK